MQTSNLINKRRTVYARFKGNILAVDLAEMGSFSSKNKNIKNLLCAIDVFTKPLKDKKGKTVLNAFIEIVNESNCKPSKLWVDQGRTFYNKLLQEWSNNNILIFSIHNEGKSIISERFIIKTLNARIHKKMTTNDSYLNKLVDQYNNTYHHPIAKKRINADCSVLI